MNVERTAGALLDWYSEHARDLPWRRTTDPYAIWISEVMLQQTQVRTVIPYWERWMRELPDIASLAAASEPRVLKLWEGLGYYRRARNLMAAAREIRARHGGRFPEAPADILSLPGIGRYTAGAIASIAFDLPEPILDGNVIRVLTRLETLGGDPRTPALQRLLWERAGSLVRAAAAGGRPQACSHLNQALMELGATLCTPVGPRCVECPVRGGCRARMAGRPEVFPELPARVAAVPVHVVVAVVRHGDRYRVRRRPADLVNGGLWEFPNAEVEGGDVDPQPVVEALLGRSVRDLEPWWVLRNSITRYRVTQRVFCCAWPGRRSGDDRGGGWEWEWRTLDELEALAFTSAHRRIVRRLAAGSAPVGREGMGKGPGRVRRAKRP